MQEFQNLAQLLRCYREEHREMSKKAFAALLGVEAVYVRRWESGKPVSDPHLSNIAEKTGIPYPALLLLNANLPVDYEIRTRRFALCPPEEELALAAKAVAEDLEGALRNWKHHPITNERDASLIHDFDHDIYPTNNPISEKMYLAAGRLIPTLNVIVKDSRGFYCGHFVGIPLRRETSQKLRDGMIC